MHIAIIHIQVKPEYTEAFIKATQDNASNSIHEPGILRFDFLQQKDDPTRFTLYEVYRTPEDPATHRETAHYLRWRDTVVDMMAVPRIGVVYNNILPTDEQWR